MKAFRVHYETEVYRVFSELIITSDETSIPQTLAAKSDKGFIIGDPNCMIRGTKEIPLEKLKVTDLTVAELLLLIDSRVSKKPEPTTPQAIKHISTEVLEALAEPQDDNLLERLLASYTTEYESKMQLLNTITVIEDPIRRELINHDCLQLDLDIRAIRSQLEKNNV